MNKHSYIEDAMKVLDACEMPDIDHKGESKFMYHYLGDIEGDINKYYRAITDLKPGPEDCLIVGGQMELNTVKDKLIISVCGVTTLFVDMARENTGEFMEREFLGEKVLYEELYPEILYPARKPAADTSVSQTLR